MDLAIVGMSDSTRHLVPDGAEIWCLAWDRELKYRARRVFEMHDRTDLEMTYGDSLERYTNTFRDCQEVITPDNYPFERVAELTGEYWCSSIAYMIALAIREARDFGLYGVDMTDDYGYQRPNTEYLLGIAKGRGLRVFVPDHSPLLKFEGPPDRKYLGRYGRLA